MDIETITDYILVDWDLFLKVGFQNPNPMAILNKEL